MTPAELKSRQRELREGFPEDMGLRVHRAISWLMRADKDKDDHDTAFIQLWIAFNACYAEDEGEIPASGERQHFNQFFDKLLALDAENRIYNAIWMKFGGPVRMFLDNRYVFQPYWNHLNGVSGYDQWEVSFERAKHAAHQALAEKDTAKILSILFNRLYVLRNQLVHGGATWNSKVNREQVKDGRMILAFLLPCIVEIMMNNPHEDWGKPFYPVVGNSLSVLQKIGIGISHHEPI